MKRTVRVYSSVDGNVESRAFRKVIEVPDSARLPKIGTPIGSGCFRGGYGDFTTGRITDARDYAGCCQSLAVEMPWTTEKLRDFLPQEDWEEISGTAE